VRLQDYELDFMLVGGSMELINDLLNDDYLECIAVGSSTRIDYKADINSAKEIINYMSIYSEKIS